MSKIKKIPFIIISVLESECPLRLTYLPKRKYMPITVVGINAEKGARVMKPFDSKNPFNPIANIEQTTSIVN